MALKPEAAIMTGLATGAIVLAFHSQATPTQADIQALPAGLKDVDESERKATFMSAGAVAVISLLTKDPTVFFIGSAVTVGMAFWTRHSNFKDPSSGVIGGVSRAGSPNTQPEANVADTVPYTMYSDDNGFVGS
jgi:hypothetical protein